MTIAMKKAHVSCVLSLAFLLAMSTSLLAVDVVTDPVGFITLNISGTNTSQYSFLGLGMTRLVTNRGVVASSPITNAIPVNATLTPGQFNGTVNGPAFFIEITSGPNAGLQDDIVGNDASTIYTADDLASLITAGQAYKVYPHWTIASVFGPNDESGLLGGTSAAAADNILIFNPLTQGIAFYYFRTNVVSGGCPIGGCGWRTTSNGSSNVADTVLYLEQGIMVKRAKAIGTNIVLTGGVKLGPTISVVNPGQRNNAYNLFGNVYPVTNLTLGTSGLFTGSTTNGLLGGTSAAAADNVLVPNGTGGFTFYYYRTNVVSGGCPIGGCGWRNTSNGAADQSGAALPMGGSFFVLRRPATNFNWVVTQPFVQ